MLTPKAKAIQLLLSAPLSLSSWKTLRIHLAIFQTPSSYSLHLQMEAPVPRTMLSTWKRKDGLIRAVVLHLWPSFPGGPVAHIQREGLVPAGLTLTPVLGNFSETLDRQQIKMMVAEEKKEGVEAPQEMQRSRDRTRVQPSSIFFHFQGNFWHYIYSKRSQPGWMGTRGDLQSYSGLGDRSTEPTVVQNTVCTQLCCTIPSQRVQLPEPKELLTSCCISKHHLPEFGSIRYHTG